MRLRLAIDLGPLQGPLAPYLWGSIGLHSLAVIATIFFGAWGRNTTLPTPSMNVALVGADPVAAAAPPPRAAPPNPQPQAAIPEPEPVEEPAAVPADPQPIDTPKPIEDDPEPERDPPKPAPTNSAPPSDDPSPVSDSDATSSFTDTEGSQVGVEGLGSDFDWYSGRLLNALYLAWRKPFLTGFSEPLDAKVGFTVAPNGKVSNVHIVTSSGERSLDRSGMRAVADAVLPPFPPNVRKDGPKDVSVIFRLLPE